MTTERCRWRESLGAHALGQLPEEERAALEAHLDGCADCRAELESLAGIARLLPLADVESIGAPPLPPASLADRVAARIRAERRRSRRRRFRVGLAASGAAAAALAAALALLVLPDGGGSPSQHVAFGSLPPGLRIAATLEPHAYGTEIHMYVKGAPSGTLCRVFLRGPEGNRMPAGTFRYRWGDDDDAVLSAALDLSAARAIGVRIGNRTYVARVGAGGSA
jgi:Putative zinc-finger